MNGHEPNSPAGGVAVFADKEFSIEEATEIFFPSAAQLQPTIPAEGEIIPVLEPPIVPSKPFIYPIKRRVSGRYSSYQDYWQLVLRVDVDGVRPLGKVSGDYYYKSGSTQVYFGSFIVHTINLIVTPTLVTIEGIATTTWTTTYNKIKVLINRTSIFLPPQPAYVQWYNAMNQSGATYTCLFESYYFRTVFLEQDSEQGITPFVSYNTALLPSGGPGRVLDVPKSYGEASIEMVPAGVPNVIPTGGAGPDLIWDNAELHASMQIHFSLWIEEPQWKVWLFHGNKHVLGPGLLGIMFDQRGLQRQGCAVFYQSQSGGTPAQQRSQLYTCVHELGHCFNLFHSFHKAYMDPPLPNRPAALSWMNYPQNFPGGSAAFWSAFPFQFDELEVIHLRHAYRNNIIMGGNPFGKGAALEGLDTFDGAMVDESGLKLEMRTTENFMLGEPVVVELKLSRTDGKSHKVHSHLHPNFGYTQVAIQRPNGEVVIYKPPIEHCVLVETTTLDEDRPALYDSVYIGYSKNGLVFTQAGHYQVRAVYFAIDGSQIVSKPLDVLVHSPISQENKDITELFMGDEQGMYLYLLGSDSETLKGANQAFDKVMEAYPSHRLAVYAQLVKGWNAARSFKLITPEGRIEVRKEEPEVASQLLNAVVTASVEGKGVDNITLNQAMTHLAMAQGRLGDEKGGKETLDRMVQVFNAKNLNKSVMQTIRSQVSAAKKQL